MHIRQYDKTVDDKHRYLNGMVSFGICARLLNARALVLSHSHRRCPYMRAIHMLRGS